MDDDLDAAKLAIHAALGDIGFERDFTRRAKCLYTGVLDKAGLAVPVSIEVTDFDFLEYPEIRIAPQYVLPDRKLPHILGIEQSVCRFR